MTDPVAAIPGGGLDGSGAVMAMEVGRLSASSRASKSIVVVDAGGLRMSGPKVPRPLCDAMANAGASSAARGSEEPNHFRR